MLRHSYIQKINMQTKGRTTPILYLKGGIKLLVSLFFNHELVFVNDIWHVRYCGSDVGSLLHIFGIVAFQILSAALGYRMTYVSVIHIRFCNVYKEQICYCYTLVLSILTKYIFSFLISLKRQFFLTKEINQQCLGTESDWVKRCNVADNNPCSLLNFHENGNK